MNSSWTRSSLGLFANCVWLLGLANDAFYRGYTFQRLSDLLIVLRYLEKQPPAHSICRHRCNVSGTAGTIAIHKCS